MSQIVATPAVDLLDAAANGHLHHTGRRIVDDRTGKTVTDDMRPLLKLGWVYLSTVETHPTGGALCRPTHTGDIERHQYRAVTA